MSNYEEIIEKAVEIFEDYENYEEAFKYLLSETSNINQGQLDDFLLSWDLNRHELFRDELYGFIENHRELYDPDRNIEKCVLCGTLFIFGYHGGEHVGDPVYDFWLDCAEDRLGFWCVCCSESWYERHNTIKVIDGQEISVIWEDDGVFRDMGAWGAIDQAESLPKSLRNVIKELNPSYHKIDGWRDYDDFETPTNWINVRTGWVGWGSHSDFHDILEKIMKGDYDLPFPVIAVFATTSNVFAINIDVYVPKENEEEFERLFQNQEHVDYDTDEVFNVSKELASKAKEILPQGGQEVETISQTEQNESIRVRQKSMDVWKPE